MKLWPILSLASTTSSFRSVLNAVVQFSRGDERIRVDIPVPDSLGKETFLVGVFTSSGNLKDQ